MFRLKVRLHGQDVKEIALESGREYVFGRGSDCDIQLQDEAGISRQHFKVFEESGSWVARVVSKFGDINVGGSPVQTAQLDIGSVVKLNGYDFIFLEQQQNNVVPLDQPQEEVPQQQEVRSVANLPATFTPNMPFEGSDEATRVMEVAHTGDPYLRIVEPSGREETIKIDAAKCIAGREEGSQILLNDRKASRRQFELMKSPQGNFVRDLGSSNGTLLNGMPLAPDELKPLKSGDVLQVGQLAIHFEVRDPHFERRLQVVPRQVMDAQMPVAQTPAYEIINYPVAQGPGGAVRVGAAGVPMSYEAPQAEAWDQAREVKEAKAKKFRFYVIAIAAIAGVVYFLSDDDGGSKKPDRKQQQAQAQTPQEQAFAKLTPQKQQFVKEAYILGNNLFMQSKMALAAEQFTKIHELLKDGYLNSRQLADECEAQAQQERNRLEVEEQMRQAAQNRVIVIENLKKCEPISNVSFSVEELKGCLAPTYERDPGNPAIEQMILKINNRVAQRDAKIAGQKAYASKVARGRELYEKAVAIEKRGDGDGAVEAYRAHLSANMPDPDGLRALSMKKVGSITATKQASIKQYMSAAETAYNAKDWKTAITNINKVKGLDPYNIGAAELNGRINREKDQKLREIYEESILNEGLGQIDQAKANWKKIIEQDHPDGTYYKRAKNKLRALGGT